MVATRSGKVLSPNRTVHGVKHALHRTTPTLTPLRRRRPKRAKDSVHKLNVPEEPIAPTPHSVAREEPNANGDFDSPILEEMLAKEAAKEDLLVEDNATTETIAGESKADASFRQRVEEAMLARESAPHNLEGDYCLLRAENDWEERRYRHRLTCGHFVKKWACLFPSCKDKNGNPRLFSRLESFNTHRLKLHVGSQVVFSSVGKAREEVSLYLKAPVHNIKGKDVHKVYMKIHHLKIRADIFFRAELACACVQHKELVITLKDEYMTHFKAQGLADYALRKKGHQVEARHSISKPPIECIVCHGGLEAATTGVAACQPEISIISSEDDVVKGDDEYRVYEEGLHEGKQEDEGVIGDEVQPSSPLASSQVDDGIIDELCERISRSLPRTRSRIGVGASTRVYETRSKGVGCSASVQACRRSGRKKHT